MNEMLLYTATVLMWIVFVFNLWQRFFMMPVWFGNPPQSFEVLRRHNKNIRPYRILVTILLVISGYAALLFNWPFEEIRNHILAALVLYLFAGIMNNVFFSREITAFAAIPADIPPTPLLVRRTDRWVKRTLLRDLLQLFAAISFTMACSNL